MLITCFLWVHTFENSIKIDNIIPRNFNKDTMQILVIDISEDADKYYVKLDDKEIECRKDSKNRIMCPIDGKPAGTYQIRVSLDNENWSEPFPITAYNFVMIFLIMFAVAGAVGVGSMIVSYITCMKNKNKIKQDDEDYDVEFGNIQTQTYKELQAANRNRFHQL